MAAVPGSTPTTTPTAYALQTPTSLLSTATPLPASSPTTSAPTPTSLIHVVKSGETLLVIAAVYGTDLDRLMEANDLNQELARRLRVGQELIIPDTAGVGGPLPVDNPPPRQIVHSVQAGDTLISIAAQYDADLDAILAANPGINPDLIYVGQQIVVPLLPPTATPTITFTPTPTDTPAPPYRAPNLLYPIGGQVIEGQNAAILLSGRRWMCWARNWPTCWRSRCRVGWPHCRKPRRALRGRCRPNCGRLPAMVPSPGV